MADLIYAAGAVAWRQGPSAIEVLLVHRQKYDDWSLPKGKRENGELAPVNAVREVREETGARVVLGRRLRGSRYESPAGPKEVDYWAGRVANTDDGAVPNHEVDSTAWLPVSEAIDVASYDRDMAVLSDFARKPPETVPLIVVRHASAGSRNEWEGDDADRPLDAIGTADALALARLLACFAPGPSRVLSSPALRCTDTVRPYAELAATPVEVSDALSRTPAADSRANLISELVLAGQPAVLCVHRENLAGVVADVCAAFGAGVPGNPSLSKAGFWALHAAAGSLTAMDRYSTS
jgi:8-oxo-dGTP diphosphatase